ncbi:uncharacterized protein BCR38DRAFT_431192 [Pseudomassariella vexata]|uniref:E3 ubiquitin-protein ligase listerin n=1 Tax=Pseudomassariella vexata TaxID=1141098 RepID=A0A1Y2E001_9PEZI|nr:uncharacterized protein BCR38DRAFT_431192 [Pseudomassariella vexata]ORY64868.1 hypothetical protein BCR38DRAFT_431192 [Pseudomassariella vexata]
MSRRQLKSRAASGKVFTTTSSSGFGAFSSTSTGSTLSYLSEPPDFSSISDANVVVSFKNLLKKDGTTKAKALEDLITYVEAHPFEQGGGAEEPVLEAWVQLYPRTSIDNSRRVRELSHTLQFELMKSARKRIEKYVPKIVATWLAGTFDRDRVVSRNATEGLSSFLTTPEKVTQFWKRCQPQILEYASNAILETKDTLSDERSTSTDDAEAKYHRVLGGSLALVLNLLQKLDAADVEKHQENYDKFFEAEKAWGSAISNDPTVRKLSCQLLLVCLGKRRNAVEAELPRLSKVYIAEGLKSSQSGSASDYIKALTTMSAEFPSIWTSDYRGKKSPSSRLKIFLEKGSQGSAVTFWDTLSQMLASLPSGIIPDDIEGAIDFMKVMKLGITRREEPRSNAVSAWTCYLNTAKHFLQLLLDEASIHRFIEETVFPLTEQYLFPVPERSSWASGAQLPVLIKAYTLAATSTNTELVGAIKKEWERLKEEYKTHMRNSLPEASKDHERSQKAIADEGSRWFALVGLILEGHAKTTDTERPIPDIPTGPSLELLQEGLKLLVSRNWKPFGAAATVESAFKNSSLLFKKQTPASNSLVQLLKGSVLETTETLLVSSSAPYIFSSIISLGDISGREQDFVQLWTTAIEAILPYMDESGAIQGVAKLVASKPSASLARQESRFQSHIVETCIKCACGTLTAGWTLFNAAIGFDALSELSEGQLARELTAHLTAPAGPASPGVLKALMLIAQKKPSILSQDQDTHMSLMMSLLSLSERSNANPEVPTLRTLLEHPLTGKSNLVEIIRQNINDVGPNSLGIDTLVQQTVQVQKAHGGLEPGSLVPDLKIWDKELSVFLDHAPDASLSLTSSLGSSYFLVSTASETSTANIKRDRSGCSIPGRMAMYTAQLLEFVLELGTLHLDKQVDLVVYLAVTAEIVADQLTIMDNEKIWKNLDIDEANIDAENLVSSARKVVSTLAANASGWRDGLGKDQSPVVRGVFSKLLEMAKSLSPSGLYSARVLSALLESLTENHGFPSSAEDWMAKLDVLKSSPTAVLPAVALMTGLGESLSVGKSVSNFCNRLVSDIAGASPQSEKSLVTLALLNACMPIYEIGLLPVANNRIVFAVRQITSWLETPETLDYRHAAEVCRSLRYLLPCIKDVYGAYWERAVEFCIHLWTEDSKEPLNNRLPYIHASLRLMSTIQSIEEPNDDLVDVLQSTSEKRSIAILELLKLPRDKETQPLQIMDAIICREVEKLPLEHVQDLSDLYGLVAVDSRAIQTAAFTVLHKALPAAQEELALDVLLEKKTAQLPHELLSLLLEAPTLEAYSDEALSLFPTSIRSYLLTWHLVFDAFQAASFKVRSDYAENLKTDNYIGPLMNFTFDVLGHSAAQGLNLDKANFTVEHIRSYDLKLADAEPEERNMQWLLIHLFYLVLKYAPGLFKAWFIECRSKQTKIAVEGWMTRFFSPIIISESLDDVAKWAATQETPAEDERELLVKVSRPAKEVTAGYEVDELHAAIAIKIPPAYPLEGVSVVGINRVAVNEKKWQSWILTTQGVITFSGGSIIDGLAAFRRNVVGALKGQTECAICYSIISSDKKMPDKKCQTCKNLFHRTCLYKWFQSSNQNTCPLCRNPIDYLGADTKARRGG